MHNIGILCPHIGVLVLLILLTLRLGERALHAWLCVIAVAMNLFVSKQISLFGLEVTATDALAVSYLLGFNLLQEFYGKQVARTHLLISFLVSTGFVLLSLFHLGYEPSVHDETHGAFALILAPLPRIIGASLLTFVVVQAFDIGFFGWLREKFEGRQLLVRLVVCLIASQIIDTFLFSFLALYGQVANLCAIIGVSFGFKCIVIALSAPLGAFASRVMKIPLPNFQFLHNYLSR